MVLATTAGALAYDLANYPEQFIVDGVFDGTIVVGERAATADVIGSIDIAASLQASSTTQVAIPGAAGSTSLSSEGFKLETGSDALELREPIGDVVDTVTENELPGLKSGRITTSEGDTEYFQYLRFKDSTNLQDMAVNYVQDDDNNMGAWLVVDTDSPFMEWEIQFPEGFESELESNGDLDDMEDKTFNILGTDFTVVKAEVGDDGTGFEMTLMGGSIADTLREGETRTYSIDGVDYEVTLVFVSDPNSGSVEVKFSVNGELTQAMEEGDTDTLSGGLQIGVRDILVNAREGVASFFLGADKIELTDSNVNDSVNTTGSIEINNENINDGKLIVQGSYPSSTKFEITDIKYQLIMDPDRSSEAYVPPGSGIREFMRRPESMISESLDLFFAGLTTPKTTPVDFNAKGDDEYQMTFTNIQGREYRFPLISNENGLWKWGDNDDDLIFVEGTGAATQIGDDDYFIVSNDRGTDEDKSVTNILRYEDYDNTDFTLEFTDLSTDNSVNVPIGTNGLGSLVIGGHTYQVNVSSRTADSPTLSIDLNADGDHGGDQVNITAWGGVTFDIMNVMYSANASTTGVNKTVSVGNGKVIQVATSTVGNEVNMTMRVFDRNFDSAASDETFVFSVNNAANNEITLSTSENDYSGPNDNSANTWTKFELDEPNDDLDDWKYGMTDWGIMIKEYNPSDSDEPNELTFEIPDEQITAEVFVTLGAVETTSAGAGTSTQVNPIAVGLAVLDRDAPSVGSTNIIAVGGPCANTVSAELLGNPENCAEGFEPGKAVIRAWDQGDTVSILVAGYESQETQGASRVLAQHEDYDLSGTEVEVVVADLNSITVQAPSAAMMDDDA